MRTKQPVKQEKKRLPSWDGGNRATPGARADRRIKEKEFSPAGQQSGWNPASVEPKGIVELTYDEADRMVTQALDCELPEPEAFVRVLLLLRDLNDQGRQPELSDSIHRLLMAAYNNSKVHESNFDDYLESVHRG